MQYENINVKNTAYIGDIHGCQVLLDEVLAKLDALGVTNIIFLGDLVDRGVEPLSVVETVNKLVKNGKARAVMGNHDWKFIRHFKGRDVSFSEDQIFTLECVGTDRIKQFRDSYMGIYENETVFLIDEENKFIISHAIAVRPKKVFNTIHNSTPLAKWFWTGFLYGRADSNLLDDQGFPTRMPVTYNVDDDLDGWKCIVGHYHACNLYMENGNRNVMCVDFDAGSGGKLAALVIDDHLQPTLVFSDSSC